MGSKKKTIFNMIFLISCFVITMYYVFHGQDLNNIANYMKQAKSIYWVLAVGCVIGFILSEASIIYYLLKFLKQKIKFVNCCLYSFVGFFFSCITPSASGGQPAQAVFMKQDDVPIHVSTIVLLMVTISYKLVLLVYGTVILLIKPKSIMVYIDDIMYWIYLGMALNVAVVGFMILLAIKPRIIEAVVLKLFDIIAKVLKLSKINEYKKKVSNTMRRFVVKSEFVLKNKFLLLKVLFITFVQRTMLFFITYLVCLSFVKIDLSQVDVTLIQGSISVAVDMLPLPGGMGITEHLFLVVFEPILNNVTVPVMIVSRGISYYTQLLISAVMTGFAYIKFYGKDEIKKIPKRNYY